MGFLKKLLFTEINPVIAKAKTKHIEESDLLPLPADIDPRAVQVPVHELRWESARSLLFSNIKVQRRYTGPAYLCYAASVFFSLMSPVLVNRFISTISAGVTAETLPAALVYGVLLGFCGFMAGFCLQHYFYRVLRAYQVGINILNERIYKHSLRLSQNARQKNQLGDVVNHMSSDSDSAADFPLIFADFVVSFFMITAIVGMLFFYLGWSALSALVVLFSLAPLTKFIAKRFTKLDDAMMSLRDQRVTLMTQTLNAIRVVKYFAWEKSVSKEVMEIRDTELNTRRRLARAEGLASLGYLGVSTLVLFVALMTHALRGQPLDAALIFTCISLFGLLEGPFGDLSNLMSRGTAAFVGARRILNYLKQDEVSFGERTLDGSAMAVGIDVHDLTVAYPEAKVDVLRSITLKVPAGSSVAIVGPVGSGKSSLLSAILGEVPSRVGNIQFTQLSEEGLHPRLAFVPQEAYIVNGSLLENLQFGEEVSAEDLRRALHNSCLSQDLRQLKGGLRTEIGEKGVNLSGGQKQRVALARAFLSRPQIVLLDDPLSAVDEETETLLCQRLLFGVWKSITRVVVTHRLAHLADFDQVVYVENGEIRGQGNFAELLKQNTDFAKFYSGHAKSQGEEGGLQVSASEILPETAATASSPIPEIEVRVTEDEDREVGAVKGTIYKDYIYSLGGEGAHRKWILALLALGASAVALLPLMQKTWLSYYSGHQDQWPALWAVGIYGVIGVLVLLGNFGNQMFWLSRGIRSAQNMHNNMLSSVLKAPVRFFDSTPVGRILQRFSRDLESVDVYLQWSFSAAVNSALQVLVSVVLIVGVMPWMLVVILPVMFLYYGIQRDYRRPAREVKRYDSIARSPRFAHFKESLQGLVVIRSFNKTSWFMKNFYDRLAHSQRMFFSHYMLNRWFSSRIPLIGGMISMSTSVMVALSAYAGWMSPGMAGLVTLYSLSFWGYLNWGVRIFADIETRMTSIERLKFFANLPSEVDVLKPVDKPLPSTWPELGGIEVKALQVRYADHLPLVLKGISFSVKAGTRVGIIGRTGSGKSTFFQSLFRFVEAETGSIEIDGVDIASVSLVKLRESMAIIPQDPTLFLGTIRNNLDRYNRYSDEEVMAALKHASMWDYVSSLPNQLNAVVTESGLNLSQGQRQLLCLARALLTKAKVIVMDEATASVDVQTDVLLQKVIREAFHGVTMLIIAHRLGTISDCDQIVEISQGEVKSIRRPQDWNREEMEHSLS